jgi:hypothetical protein
VPDNSHLVGQNEIEMKNDWAYDGRSEEILSYSDMIIVPYILDRIQSVQGMSFNTLYLNMSKNSTNYNMIMHDENYGFFVTFKKNRTYTLRWKNQKSKAVVSEKEEFLEVVFHLFKMLRIVLS